MARIAGRNGAFYMALTSAGTPSPVAYLSQWSLNFTNDKIEVTAFGDTTKVYVGGLPDCQGTYTGFYDDASVQMYTAASDSVPRKFYIYPSTLTATQYWYGTGIFDMSIDLSVDGPAAISGNFAAASVVTKQG